MLALSFPSAKAASFCTLESSRPGSTSVTEVGGVFSFSKSFVQPASTIALKRPPVIYVRNFLFCMFMFLSSLKLQVQVNAKIPHHGQRGRFQAQGGIVHVK